MFLLVPSMVWAYELTIEGIDLPEAGSPANDAEISVYFDIRDGIRAIPDITADNCTLRIDGETPKVKNAEVKLFKDGNHGVGILFIFPIAKNYSEETFGIRNGIGNTLLILSRDIDFVNLVPYDDFAKPLGWSKASDRVAFKELEEITTGDVLMPNLFNAFVPAVASMNELKGVSKKYLVIVSDAEGTGFDSPENAIRLTEEMVLTLRKNHITPIVVGYSADGVAAMPNVHYLKRIAKNADGVYFQADDRMKFAQIMMKEIPQFIYGRYVYRAVLNAEMPYINAKDTKLELVVKTEKSTDTAAVDIAWPALKKGLFWRWLFLGIVGVIIGGFGVFSFVRRRENKAVDKAVRSMMATKTHD